MSGQKSIAYKALGDAIATGNIEGKRIDMCVDSFSYMVFPVRLRDSITGRVGNLGSQLDYSLNWITAKKEDDTHHKMCKDCSRLDLTKYDA